MLQKLSYFNITIALIYLLAYLRNGTFASTMGILVVIVFNWLCLRSYERNNYNWKALHYLTGLWSVYFISTLLYGVFNIINSFATSDFISTDTLVYLISTLVFCITVTLLVVLYFYRNLRGAGHESR